MRQPLVLSQSIKIFDIITFGRINSALLNKDRDREMPDVIAAPVSLKCKICGGDIVNDYLAGTSACANCGNRWNIAALVPDYDKYSKIISNINKANSILSGESKASSGNEAKLLFKQAVIDCGRFNDPVSSDLVRICGEGQKQADLLTIYVKGKNYYEKKSYGSAMKELNKVHGYRDADAMVEICKEEIEKERKKQIPWAVVFSLIIPAGTALALKDFAGWPIAVCILIFLAGSAGLGYVLYRGGIPSVIIKIISFLGGGPLLLYCVLAYGFHLSPGYSLTIAIGAPIALFILFAVMTEKKSK